MGKKILVIDGHPDAAEPRLVHQLSAAYLEAAEQAGHEARLCRLADLEFPWLRTADDFLHGRPPVAVV